MVHRCQNLENLEEGLHFMSVEEMVPAVASKVAAAFGWVVKVVNHPHNPHSHHPEVHYAHPVGHHEGGPQVHNTDDAYLDILGTMFHQIMLG